MGRAGMKPAVPLADMLEKDWDRQVRELATTLGYRYYHTLRSKGSQPGYPDITLVSAQRRRVVFLELKREKGVVSDKQAAWLRDLHRAGAEVYVVRPRNLDHLARVLSSPVSMAGYVEARGALLLELDPYLRKAA